MLGEHVLETLENYLSFFINESMNQVFLEPLTAVKKVVVDKQ